MRQWLIEMRKNAGKTQAELAMMASITQPSYNAIEAGKNNPKPETAQRIAKILNFKWTRFYEEGTDE